MKPFLLLTCLFILVSSCKNEPFLHTDEQLRAEGSEAFSSGEVCSKIYISNYAKVYEYKYGSVVEGGPYDYPTGNSFKGDLIYINFASELLDSGFNILDTSLTTIAKIEYESIYEHNILYNGYPEGEYFSLNITGEVYNSKMDESKYKEGQGWADNSIARNIQPQQGQGICGYMYFYVIGDPNIPPTSEMQIPNNPDSPVLVDKYNVVADVLESNGYTTGQYENKNNIVVRDHVKKLASERMVAISKLIATELSKSTEEKISEVSTYDTMMNYDISQTARENITRTYIQTKLTQKGIHSESLERVLNNIIGKINQ